MGMDLEMKCPARRLVSLHSCSALFRCLHALQLARVSITGLKPPPAPRTSLRLGLPSKGRMAEDTMNLLKVDRCTEAFFAF